MTLAPPELEERHRRFLNGRGDDIAPLISFLRGGGTEARADSRAWAALILSHIYLLKGRLALAASYLRYSAAAFRKLPDACTPLALWINRAILLKWEGRIDRAERLLRLVFVRAVRTGDSLSAAEAASNLALLLTRGGKLREAEAFHAFARQSYRAMRRDAELAGTELVGSLIRFESGRREEAVDDVFMCMRRCEERSLEREALAGALLLFEMYLRRDDDREAEWCAQLIAQKETVLSRFRLLKLQFLFLRYACHEKRGEEAAARRAWRNAERLRMNLGVDRKGLWLPPVCETVREDVTVRGDRCAVGGTPAGESAESRCTYIVPRSGADTVDARTRRTSADAFITCDRRMLRMLEEVRGAAPLPVPVLIEGESGVGKEIVARMIHDASGRGRRPFMPVNTAALPRELVGSILFGHARGAFTGAAARRCGLVEAAGEGTLFLDEIGEIDKDAQVKLLRLIDRGEYMLVGECAVRHAGARIVTSTNRDLATAVEDGDFRGDLYHRLRVLSFRVPPLRERREDIPILVDHFIRWCCGEYHLGPIGISDAAMHILTGYDWPGNVRELKHEVIRAVVKRRTGMVRVCHLSARIMEQNRDRPLSPECSLPVRLADFERGEISRALREEGGNRTRAAAALGLRRTTLIHRMKRLGIE